MKTTTANYYSSLRNLHKILFTLLFFISTFQLQAQLICNAEFTFNPSTHNPDSISFHPVNNHAVHYNWSFGDGTHSSNVDPWHFYAPGNYWVCLTIYDSTSAGVCTDTWCDSIHAPTPQPPNCNAHFTHYSLNNYPDSVHFYPAVTGYTSYHYDFGDGHSANGGDPWHHFAPGVWWVCLSVTYTNSMGTCTATWCDSVHVAPPQPPLCNAQFTSHPSTHNPDSISFVPNANSTHAQYTWNFGDGTTSHNHDPWHFFAPGSYWVCLTVTDSNAAGVCTATWCDSVHAPTPQPLNCNAHFTHYSLTNFPDSVHFYPAVTGYTSYHYDFGDGHSANGGDPWHHFAPGVWWVCLTVTNTNSLGSCTATWCDSVHVAPPQPPLCNAQFTFHPSTHNPDSISFVPNANSSHAQYTWNFGDGTTSHNHDPWHFFAPGSYWVCLTVTDSNAAGVCTATWCDSVHAPQLQQPNCNAHFTHYSLNNYPDSVHFYPAVTGYTSYHYDFGDGHSANGGDPWHHFAPGVWWVCLTVTNTNSLGTCTATWCDSVHVAPPQPPLCNAQFTFHPSTHNPDSISFVPNANSTHAQYTWNFGDGTTSHNHDPWHFFAPGSYWVCLTVTDSNAAGVCTATWCDSVHAPTPQPLNCNAHFTHYSLTNFPDSVHFYPAVTGYTSYHYDFGDGHSANGGDPWHHFTPGVWWVCLTVTYTNSLGSCTATWCDSVHVAPPQPPLCNAQFTFHPSTHNPDSISFVPNSNSSHAQYTWNFGDGTTSHNHDPWHFYAPGSYWVCLTVTDSNSAGVCTATWCDSVHAPTPQPPNCNAHFTHYSLNNHPDSVHFYPSVTGYQSYHYDFGDGHQANGSDPWHHFAPGVWWVCLTVTYTNSMGTCTATWCDSVHIGPPPPPFCNAEFQKYPQIGNPANIHFFPVTSNTAHHFNWNFGDGSTSTNGDPWHMFALGTYWVCLTVSDSNSAGACTDTWCDSIHIGPPLPPICNAQFHTFFLLNNPDSVHFAAVNTHALHYSWNFGDGSSSPNHDPWHHYAPGSYWVCLTVTDSNSAGTCTATWCDSLIIGQPQPPLCNAEFIYHATPSPVSYHFMPVNNNYNTYSWSFGDNTSSTNHDPWHQYTALGNYIACLTVTLTNSTGSCTDTWCDTISVAHLFTGNVNIFANSASSLITVNIQNIVPPAQLMLSNSQGQTIYLNNQVTNGTLNIASGNNPSGVLFYKLIDSGSNNYTGKVVVIHN